MLRKTLIVGLGNPILGDDGVGWQVASQVAEVITHTAAPASSSRPGTPTGPGVEVDCLAVGGLRLMERMEGYDHVILIDAISSGHNQPGTVLHFQLEDLPEQASGHMNAVHDTSMKTALQVGRSMGASLPDQIDIVAVEARALFEFSEHLTPPVAAAVPRAVKVVLDLLSET
jgi:hydrogenase maturation protease